MAKSYSKEQSSFKPPKKVAEKIYMSASEFNQKYGKKVFTKKVLSTPKPRKPINKKSERRTKEEREYSKLRKEFLETKMICEVEGCSNQSCDVHHKKHRSGSLYLDVTYFMAVCRDCHTYIHENPDESYEKGYLIKHG